MAIRKDSYLCLCPAVMMSFGLTLLQRSERQIRITNEVLRHRAWGFVTCRCTYKSQAKWDQFLSRIKDDARRYLKEDGCPDLFESMDWPVIEDPKLDGVHYAVAARRVREWVIASQSNDQNNPPVPASDLKSRFPWIPQRDPRHDSGFIYANEDVVNSVLENPMGVNDYHGNKGFVYLVNHYGIQEWGRITRSSVDNLN